MSTNDEIIEEVEEETGLLIANEGDNAEWFCKKAMNRVRTNERVVFIDAIRNWWRTRPQHLFATTPDIEELIDMLLEVD